MPLNAVPIPSLSKCYGFEPRIPSIYDEEENDDQPAMGMIGHAVHAVFKRVSQLSRVNVDSTALSMLQKHCSAVLRLPSTCCADQLDACMMQAQFPNGPADMPYPAA